MQSRSFPDLAERVSLMPEGSAPSDNGQCDDNGKVEAFAHLYPEKNLGGRLMRRVICCSSMWLILALNSALSPVSNYLFSLVRNSALNLVLNYAINDLYNSNLNVPLNSSLNSVVSHVFHSVLNALYKSLLNSSITPGLSPPIFLAL